MDIFEKYIQEFGFLETAREPIYNSVEMLSVCFLRCGKLLTCGNGGSCADADHISGELLKGFMKKRSLSDKEKESFLQFGEIGADLASLLQGSLPAINLCAHSALITAIANDISGDMIFAQQVIGLGAPGDVLLCISTSGNSANIYNACITAKARGLKIIALTGRHGGRVKNIADIVICAPANEVHYIQDMHSSIYHVICAMVESEFWDA